MNELDRIRHVYQERRRLGREARYSPFNRGHLFLQLGLERELAALFARERPWPDPAQGIASLRLLDAGCGGGWWLRTLLRWGARPELLTGVDLLPTAVTAARAVHPVVRIEQADASALPFPDGVFDVVSQFTMFSSVLNGGLRRQMARELRRVLRPGGVLLWYDFTFNPRNRDTHGISKRELHQLFPEMAGPVRRVTLAPPLARLTAPRSWLLATALETLPPLRSHLLAALR